MSSVYNFYSKKVCPIIKWGLDFCRNDGLMWVIVGLIFAANLCYMLKFGVYHTLSSDDLSYVNSGIYLKNNGVITMHDHYPSAQIMPGMPVLIAAISAVFGEGTLLWVMLKLLWITLGSATGLFIYKNVRFFAPWWCASVAVLPLLLPNFWCVNNLMLTETPYIFFFCVLLYLTFRMGQTDEKKYAWLWLAAFMAALMFRANILSYPIFAAVYLLIRKKKPVMLLKRAAVVVLAVLCMVIPWGIRNYSHFHSFIPFTYGVGNPLLLGTYQGDYAPSDEGFDYENNVDKPAAEKFAEFYDENGQVKEEYQRYIMLETQKIKAEYRIKEWLRRSPATFIFTTFIQKPYWLMTEAYYPDHSAAANVLGTLQTVVVAFCAFCLIVSLIKKRLRREFAFLALFYAGTVYIHSFSLTIPRYGYSLLSILFVAAGIGLSLVLPDAVNWMRRIIFKSVG